MSKRSRYLVNAETTLIRKYLEQNLDQGKTHNDMMNELQLKPTTYYRYVKRIMNEDAKAWDKVHIDSAQYRAVRLIEALQNCVNVCKQIINNPNTENRDRIEAAKTLCLSEANIFKIIQEGPVFKMSLPTTSPIFPTKNNNQLTDNDNSNGTN